MDRDVRTYFADTDKVNIDKTMALRFLRIRGGNLDDDSKNVFEDCLREFSDAVSYKASYRYFDIDINGNEIRFDDAMTIKSNSLSRHLADCKGAFVFVATCSSGVDRLIAKHSSLRVSRAVIIDAIGSSAIEGMCDKLCEKLSEDYGVELESRFSPGYGDVSIHCQKDVLAVCDSARKIGVTLTDNNMMVPTKSVSAIVGVKQVCTG